MSAQTPNFWDRLLSAVKGTNFWIALLVFILSMFGGNESLASQVVMSVSGLIAAFFAVRQFVNSAKFGGWKEAFVQGNTLNYLAQVLLLVGIPNIDQLIPPAKSLVQGFIDGNWGNVISSLVTLATIVFYLFIKKTR